MFVFVCSSCKCLRSRQITQGAESVTLRAPYVINHRAKATFTPVSNAFYNHGCLSFRLRVWLHRGPALSLMMTLSGSRSLRTDLFSKGTNKADIQPCGLNAVSPAPHTHNSPHLYGSNTSPPDGTSAALQGQAKGKNKNKNGRRFPEQNGTLPSPRWTPERSQRQHGRHQCAQ